jgi:hypothetical protein
MEETMYVNLTAQDVTVYPRDTPDRITPGTVAPIQLIPTSPDQTPARMGDEIAGDPFEVDGITIEVVQFVASQLPNPVEGVWLIVPAVVVALTLDRPDLVCQHEFVRDTEGAHGRILGCRAFAANNLAQPTTVKA